jgi:hypothetical protein
MPGLANIMAQSGALDGDMLKEFQKWRLPVQLDSEAAVFDEAAEAVEAIEEALESKEAVEVRATDLNVLRQYMKTQARGRLRVKTEDEDQTFVITFGTTLLGGVLIPWQADSLEAFLTNGESYLLHNGIRYFFSRVEDLFFGDRKVFILCTPTETIRA